MPTYQYRCNRCGYIFEELVPKIRQRYVECPECEDTAVITDKIYPVNGNVAGSWFNNLNPDE